MVSQMAAGAGGVNTARKALKNAIDRDIQAQMNNIELQFKGVEAAHNNINDQVNLMEAELLFEQGTSLRLGGGQLYPAEGTMGGGQ